MARIVYPAGRDANPVVIVEPDEVMAWLRNLADGLGLQDRESSTVQVSFPEYPKDQQAPPFIWSIPQLAFMLSGIPNSRRDVDTTSDAGSLNQT